MITKLPTPLEILLDPVSLAIIAMYAGLMLWEAFAPAKALPEIKGWKLRGMISFAVFFCVLANFLVATSATKVAFSTFNVDVICSLEDVT